MASCNCIDVSEHNGYIDWNAAKADGVEYALIRAGFGQNLEKQDDKYFHINMENAIAAGVKVGVYFYSYASDGDAAAGEAEHCLRLIEPYRKQLSLPVFYDLEEEKIKPNVYSIYTMFEAILKESGYNVGCYASQYWFDTCLKPVEIDYCWVAKWGGKQPDWGIDIWQFTSTGHCEGVEGNVDCNVVINTDMTALIDGGDDQQNDDQQGGDTVNVELHKLRKGSTGGEVETIQILLNALGFRDQNGAFLAVDGIFGAKTEYAVKSYQRARGLAVDGIVGAQTWNRILK